MHPVLTPIWVTYERLVLPWRAMRARRFLTAYDRRLAGVDQPRKVATLIRLLNARRPRCIVELGAGRNSTTAFAAWSTRNGARFVSHEALPEWAEWARTIAQSFGAGDMSLTETQLRDSLQARNG